MALGLKWYETRCLPTAKVHARMLTTEMRLSVCTGQTSTRKRNNDVSEELLQYATVPSNSQHDKETLCVVVDAIVYQPTNECPNKDHQCQREYMTRSPPVALPKDLEKLRSGETEIVAAPDILQCKGCCGFPHNFLSAVNHQLHCNRPLSAAQLMRPKMQT